MLANREEVQPRLPPPLLGHVVNMEHTVCVSKSVGDIRAVMNKSAASFGALLFDMPAITCKRRGWVTPNIHAFAIYSFKCQAVISRSATWFPRVSTAKLSNSAAGYYNQGQAYGVLRTHRL